MNQPGFSRTSIIGRLSVGAIAMTMAIVCTACSKTTSVGEPPSTFAAAGSATTTTVPASTTTTAPAVSATTASGTVTDSAGDQVQVTLSLGTPATAANVRDPLVQGCASALTSQGSSLQRSAAIPITVTTRVLSSSATSVLVNMLGDMHLASKGYAGSVETGLINGHMMLWATSYSDQGQQCTPASDGDLGSWATEVVHDQAPGSTDTWRSFLIAPEAVTPASGPASSPQNSVSALLFDPDVALANTNTTGSPMSFSPGQPGLVACTGDATSTTSGSASSGELALNVAGAAAQGCKAG